MGRRVKRGDVRWYRFPQPDTQRPVVVLTHEDGMSKSCAVNCDHLQTVTQARVGSLITTLSAERMVEVVSSSPVIWKKEEIPLSISVGVGQYDSQCSPEDITSRSDHALYMAKQAGKNTVRVFESAKKY